MKPKDEKKLDDIFFATCHLATERGLFGLTLAQIAKEAGIATSTLYVYFSDKETLLNEIYRRAKIEAVGFYSGKLDSSIPFKKQVRYIWNKMLDYRLQKFEQASFMEQFVISSLMSVESQAYTERISEGLMQIVLEGQESEILKCVPVIYLSSSFIGSVRETARLIRAKSIVDNTDSRELAFRLCWDSISD
jgi:TetR/AcrR family transcriptional regulator, repressor of fatR-cypB operon